MTLLTCLACGHQAPDVQMTIVELPPEEQRPVEVPIVVATDRLGRPLGMEYLHVPERFVNEPRCRDYKAKTGSTCQARVRAMEAPKPPPADAVEEGPSWLRQP